MMIFDECTPYPVDKDKANESMRLSLDWAELSKRLTTHSHRFWYCSRWYV